MGEIARELEAPAPRCKADLIVVGGRATLSCTRGRASLAPNEELTRAGRAVGPPLGLCKIVTFCPLIQISSRGLRCKIAMGSTPWKGRPMVSWQLLQVGEDWTAEGNRCLWIPRPAPGCARERHGPNRATGTYQGTTVDLQGVAAHLAGVGPYTYEDAGGDLRLLIARAKTRVAAG